MTSLEIAELVEKRHDNVKRTKEALASAGIIELPQIEEIKTTTLDRTFLFICSTKDQDS